MSITFVLLIFSPAGVGFGEGEAVGARVSDTPGPCVTCTDTVPPAVYAAATEEENVPLELSKSAVNWLGTLFCPGGNRTSNSASMLVCLLNKLLD